MYRQPDPDLSQGDIIDHVPLVRLRQPLEVVRQVTMKGGRIQYAPYPYPPVEGKTPDDPGKSIQLPPFHVEQGEQFAVFMRFTRAIVLNYDCDLVNEQDHCLITIVRPLTAVNEADRDIIRGNRNYNHFYLPADPAFGLVESYADLRQVTCLDPSLIEQVGRRLVSLTPTGVDALQAQLFRFLTRRDLNAPGGPPGPQPPKA